MFPKHTAHISVWLGTIPTVSSTEDVFHLIYYNAFEYVVPRYVPLRKLNKVVVMDSTRFSSTGNVLYDAGPYVIPKHSVTINVIPVRMPTVCRLQMTSKSLIVLFME